MKRWYAGRVIIMGVFGSEGCPRCDNNLLERKINTKMAKQIKDSICCVQRFLHFEIIDLLISH